MASRTMHLAITSMLLEDIPLGDNKRLMFGAVIPDAARPGWYRAGGHFCPLSLCSGGVYGGFPRDFAPYNQGSVFFFTRQMADAYIPQALKICREELSALERGGGHMDEPAFARKGSCKIGEKLFPPSFHSAGFVL